MNLENASDALEYLSVPDLSVLQGRSIPITTFFSEGEFWTPILRDKDVQVVRVAGIQKGLYFAKDIVDEGTDLHISLIDLLHSRASFGDIVSFGEVLTKRILDLFTSVAKIDWIHDQNDRDLLLPEFVQTEVEYLLITARSTFDDMHRITEILWNRYVTDLSRNRKPPKQLPSSFAKMVIKEQTLISSEALQQTRGLPASIADFYVAYGEFFQRMKSLRDQIVHHSASLGFFFIVDQGVAISEASEFYRLFPVFHNLPRIPNGLVSLRPFLGHIVETTLSATHDLSMVIERTIRLPATIIPDHVAYVRGPQVRSYRSMKRQLAESSWWDESIDPET